MEQPQTWRETGRFLTPAELDKLSEEQRVQYYAESGARSPEDFDRMPQPHGTILRDLTARLDDRRQHRAAS
jgi:hypothetical protein